MSADTRARARDPGQPDHRASIALSAHPVTLLQVEPTTRCNYTCGFCCGRSMDQSDLAFSDYERALDALPGLRRVELHGEGEPTLHPRYADMVRLAHARGATVSTITNGSFLEGERLEAILGGGIDVVFVSIESADDEEFHDIRGGHLPQVKAGIRRLLRLRDERGLSRPSIGFSVTVLRRTTGALPGIVQLYRELGMDGGISLHMLNTMPAYVEHYRDGMRDQLLSKAEQALAWTRYKRALRSGSLSGPTLHFSDEVFGQIDGSQAGSGRSAREYRSCIWLDRGLYLNRHGATSGCARIKNTDAFGFGRLAGTDASEIVAARDAMARRLRGGLVPEACAGCFVAESIQTRMANLLERRPCRAGDSPESRAAAAPAIGEVPADPAAEQLLLPLCDGTRTAREIVASLATRQGCDFDAARARLLPILGELVRHGTLVLDA